MKLLLDHKASATLADATGNTALYYAALSGGDAAVNHIKATLGDGFAALINQTNANGETPLMAAAASGATTVCGLLIEGGADVSAKATGGMHEGRSAPPAHPNLQFATVRCPGRWGRGAHPVRPALPPVAQTRSSSHGATTSPRRPSSSRRATPTRSRARAPRSGAEARSGSAARRSGAGMPNYSSALCS